MWGGDLGARSNTLTESGSALVPLGNFSPAPEKGQNWGLDTHRMSRRWAKSAVGLFPLPVSPWERQGRAHSCVLTPNSLDSSSGLQKAVVKLDPAWVRVLEEDRVTLRCQGTFSPEDSSTKWFHNESQIAHQGANYVIASVKVKDSGMYRCQTALSTMSDPVQLEVQIGELKGKRGPELLGESLRTVWVNSGRVIWSPSDGGRTVSMQSVETPAVRVGCWHLTMPGIGVFTEHIQHRYTL